MIDSSHIVEWLWNINKKPEVYASNEEPTRPVKNTLVFDTSCHFDSASYNDQQWWKIDFKIPVYITGYLIRSNPASTNNGWLYNWSVLASNDNIKYKIIHGPIQDEKEEKAYRINKIVKARYIRIDGFSKYKGNKNQIAFYYAKFFGSLNAPYKYNLSCRSLKNAKIDLMRIILLIQSSDI